MYSIGQISLLYLAQTTDMQPNATPQKKRPTLITQMTLIIQNAIETIKSKFMYIMILSFPYLKNGSQNRAPKAEPSMHTLVKIESYMVWSSSSHSCIVLKAADIAAHEPNPIPTTRWNNE